MRRVEGGMCRNLAHPSEDLHIILFYARAGAFAILSHSQGSKGLKRMYTWRKKLLGCAVAILVLSPRILAQAPRDLRDGWQVGDPRQMHVNVVTLERLDSAIVHNQFGNI